MLYFDLDTVILGSLHELALTITEETNAFYMLRGWKRDIWTSMFMAWNGDFSNIKETFLDLAATGKYKEIGAALYFISDKVSYRGDQDFLFPTCNKLEIPVKIIQNIYTGVFSFKHHCTKGIPLDARVVCFHGLPRPHQAAKTIPWVRDYWNVKELAA